MGKFGSLAASSNAFKVEIIDVVTEKVIRDKADNPAWIEVYPADGDVGRKFDREERAASFQRARRNRGGRDETIPDPREDNASKCAALTKSWYLVDPDTLEQIDVPCTFDNAKELYNAPNMIWLFVQVWAAASDSANFMRRSAKNSTPTQSTSSETDAS